jgi:hypothetical protein
MARSACETAAFNPQPKNVHLLDLVPTIHFLLKFPTPHTSIE